MKHFTKLLSIFILGIFMVYGKVGFRLELRGGYGTLPKEDLNLGPAAKERSIKDEFLFYAPMEIEWGLSVNGNLPMLERIFPVEGEAILTFGVFGISLGADYLYSKKTTDYGDSGYVYFRDTGERDSWVEEIDPWKTSITGLFPNIKLHLILPGFVKFGSLPLDLDLYAGGGPILGRFEEFRSYSSSGDNWSFEEQQKNTGKGKGWGATVGANLNYNLTGNIGISLGARYLYAKATDFTGSIEESWTSTYEGETDTGSQKIEGNWLIYRTNNQWERYGLDSRLSIFPEALANKIRSMEVDFSGAQFFLGIFLRF